MNNNMNNINNMGMGMPAMGGGPMSGMGPTMGNIGGMGGMNNMNSMNMGGMGMGGGMNGMNSMGGGGGMGGMGGMPGNMGNASAGRGINPSQLMGNMAMMGGGMGPGAGGGINPSQILQQQQQQQAHQRDRDHQIAALQQQRGNFGMNNMGNMNMAGMGSMGGMAMNNMSNMGGMGHGGMNMNSINSMGGNMGSMGANMGGMGNMAGINPNALSNFPSSPHGPGPASDPIPRPGTSMSMGSGGGVTATSMSMGGGGMGNMGGLGGNMGGMHAQGQGQQQTGNVYPPSGPHPSQGGHPQSHGHPSQHPQQGGHLSQQPGLQGLHGSQPGHGPPGMQGPQQPGQGQQGHHPGQRPDPAQVLAAFGMTKEQYAGLNPQDKIVMNQKIQALMAQQQRRMREAQQQQQQGMQGMQGMQQGQQLGGGLQDEQRPRSSASMSSATGFGPQGQGPQQQGMQGMHPGDPSGMGMMPPPPPRPSTAMSSHSASGRSVSGSGGPQMGMGMQGMGNMQGMGGSPGQGMNMGSRPGTAMGMRGQGQGGMGLGMGLGLSSTLGSGMSTGMGMGLGLGMGNISGTSSVVPSQTDSPMNMGGMGMGMMPGQMARHSSGSQGPGSPVVRPPSRAMSVSSVSGGNDGNANMVGTPGPGAGGMINGAPATPKHPGTPQMGHGMPGGQNQNQGTPPPTSPAMNGPTLKRKASGMGMPESPRLPPGAPGMNMGMGMGNNMNLNMNMGNMGNMGPPSGVPNHQQQNGLQKRPSIGSGLGGLGTPTVSAATIPGSNTSTPTTMTQPQTPTSAQGHGQGHMQGTPTPSTPRQTSVPPAQQNQTQSQSQNQIGGDAGVIDGTGKASTPVPNGITNSLSSSSSTAITTSSSSAQGATAAASGTPAPGSSTSTGSPAQTNGPVIPQLPPLPANVNLNPAVTKVTAVPLVGSDKAIPMLTAEEIEDIKKWQEADKEYETIWKGMKDRMDTEMRGEVFGKPSLKWWEKGSLAVNPGARFRRGMRPEPFDVKYPGKGRRERDYHHGRNKKIVKREGLKIPRRLEKEDANRPERLVPIRLEFDVDHYRMRDTFVWNLNDPIVTPEHFAQSLCEDYNLSQNYHSLIVKTIQDQLGDYKSHSPHYDAEGSEFSDVEDTLEKGSLDEKSAAWWESWRKRLRTEAGFVKSGKRGLFKKKRKVVKDEYEDDADVEMTDVDDEKPMAIEDFEVDDKEMGEDMRILIKLDIIVGTMKLDDQFEWDLDNLTASPEQFAEVYAQDLGLGGEFKTAIAHAIREQVQTYQKSLYIVGRPSDNTPIQDEDLRSAFLPSLLEGARAIDQVSSFTPLLNYLSDGEIERNEKERDKDMNKRRKRNTRGRRGVNLPDREPIRTHRTPAIGFPELDPATLALAAAANAPVSRRAAAAAASLTIANMVASENGMPLLPTNVPAAAPQPPPSAAKEKKPKGLFKAPPIPESILHPRARVDPPTSSTAADVTSLPAPLENDPPPSMSAPDTKVTKSISAKRAKELEREAKEKEFVDGQHPNMINGVWHCSNCGCPDDIAIGRRKGPLGDKSQCGVCGKYWHRHRRPRPVEYNTDPEYHRTAIKKENEVPKSVTKKKAGRGQSNTVPTTPAELPSEPPTPARRRDPEEFESPTRPSSPPARQDDDRAVSPVSTVSSASEPPLAQKIKTNGTASAPRPSSPDLADAVAEVKEEPSASAEPAPASTVTQSPPIAPASPARSWPPPWLSGAMHSTQARYPNDRFELALRKVSGSTSAEWRIKCVDCPGKLYKPGPGETLSNFEVHLKNRQHRQRVDERISGDS